MTVLKRWQVAFVIACLLWLGLQARNADRAANNLHAFCHGVITDLNGARIAPEVIEPSWTRYCVAR